MFVLPASPPPSHPITLMHPLPATSSPLVPPRPAWFTADLTIVYGLRLTGAGTKNFFFSRLKSIAGERSAGRPGFFVGNWVTWTLIFRLKSKFCPLKSWLFWSSLVGCAVGPLKLIYVYNGIREKWSPYKMIYTINMHTTVYQFWRFVNHHEQSVIDHYARIYAIILYEDQIARILVFMPPYLLSAVIITYLFL